MGIVWFLIFNCTEASGFHLRGQSLVRDGIEATNLAFHLEKPYKTERACMKEASRGAGQVYLSDSCYFVCLKGYEGRK